MLPTASVASTQRRMEKTILLFLIFFEVFGTAALACTTAEKEALQQIRGSLVAPSDIFQSWREDVNCCKWRGVTCDGITWYVTELDLSREGLSGQLDSALVTLQHLEHLDLSSNKFYGLSIPKFLGHLNKLRYLNLSLNSFNGRVPTQLGNLSRLEVLDVSFNNVHADKLEWLSNLQHLKHLNMHRADLSMVGHDWMHTINSIASLEELHLGLCGLSVLPMALFPLNLTLLRVLDLHSNKFQSSIPLWMANITTLESIDLSYCSFNPTHSYPFSKLPRLQVINLDNSVLKMNVSKLFAENWRMVKVMVLSYSECYGNLPVLIGNITTLVHLDLSHNEIRGDIPKEIVSLENLEYLDLGYNHIQGASLESFCSLINLVELNLPSLMITGSIPKCLGEMSSVRVINLHENQLIGTLPTTIGQLWKLESLDISSNFLHGAVSEEHFRNLSRLTYLDMSFNSLMFHVSPNWIPPFQLTVIGLASCNLAPGFPSWLQTQMSVSVLDLSSTSISGVVPPWFWNITSTSSTYWLSLSNNIIQGQLPNPFNSQQKNYFDISLNNFFGPMPYFNTSITYLDISNNELTGGFPPNSTIERMQVILAFRNKFSWILPSVSKFYELKILDLSSNNLSGPIPSEMGNIDLRILDLSNNHLSGNTNWSAFSMFNLRSLHLSNNNLSGNFPFSLQKSTNLYVLDLGENKFCGKIPSWMGRNFSNLRVLRLRSNMFEGSVPSQLSELSSLQVLDMSHNHLTGTIPISFGNLAVMKTIRKRWPEAFYRNYYQEWLILSTVGTRKYTTNLDLMTVIDLSENYLSGEIPPKLADLFGLIVLNVSGNKLTGKIPEKIGNLRQLIYLDMSRNHLSGEIPASIADLTFLSYLNLSHNNLSGKIPQGRQLQTLDPSIYNGNSMLCGAPLNTSCPGDVKPTIPTPRTTTEDGAENEIVWFFVGVAPGYVMGFWGVLGTLVLKKSWRISYFRFFDRMGGYLLTAVAVNIERFRKKLGRS